MDLAEPVDVANGVRFSTAGAVGLILLDRPQQMNALNRAIVRLVRDATEQFLADARVRCIVIASADRRAFCAGGDVRVIRELVLAGRHDEACGFFADEFELNYRLATASKPVIAIIDGICMGGGVGLSIHAPFRVVTERALMSMPEVAIGYFPDVGTSHALPRLRDRLGFWMGLTGAALRGGDAVKAGLATHYMSSGSLGRLMSDLQSGDDPVDACVQVFAEPPPPSALDIDRKAIATIFDCQSLAMVRGRLAEIEQAWATQALAAIERASPLALAVTWQLLSKGEASSLRRCLDREFEAACWMIRQTDFAEGVRAILVDKDRSPVWSAPADPPSFI